MSITNLDTLYTLDKTGKIRFYNVEVVVDNGSYTIESKTGIVSGTTVGRSKNVSQGKQGRTIEEQAVFEATSDWRSKKDEGYKSKLNLSLKAESLQLDISGLSIPDIFTALEIKYNTDSRWYPLPMLADKYKTHKAKVKFPLYAQPKLNGVRCLALYDADLQEVVLVSRGGKTYNIPHIEQELTPWFLRNQNAILDGEIYCHGEPLQKISGAARKGKDAPNWLEYHVYDLVLQQPQSYRVGILLEYFEQLRELGVTHIVRVATFQIASQELVKEKHDMAVSKGYEGLILRNPNAEYMIGFRDKCLLKVKEFEDAEFEIVGCKVDVDKTVGESFVFELKNDLNAKTFYARPTGTIAEKEFWYSNIAALVGAKCTIRFQERTRDNLPHQGHVRADLSRCLTIEEVNRQDL